MTTTPSEVTLEPCPFCGVKLRVYSEQQGYWHPRGNCTLAGFEMMADGYSEERWNTRAALTNRDEAIEEAAKVAERYPSSEAADVPIIRGIAKAIRALKSSFPREAVVVERIAEAMADVIANRHGHERDDWLNDERREEARAAYRALKSSTPTTGEASAPPPLSEGWTPTAANINALPDPLRRYIHDLETRCDPTGDVQTIHSQREQINGLLKRVRELSTPAESGAGAREDVERVTRALLSAGRDYPGQAKVHLSWSQAEFMALAALAPSPTEQRLREALEWIVSDSHSLEAAMEKARHALKVYEQTGQALKDTP